MAEQMLVIIEPDGVRRGVGNEIRPLYAEAGLDIKELEPMRFSEKRARAFYQMNEGEPSMEGLVLTLTSGECEVLIIEGEDVIEVAGAINKDFDSVHGSDSHNSFIHEVSVVTRKNF